MPSGKMQIASPSASAALSSRVNGLSWAAGSSVRSMTATAEAFRTASPSASAGKGRNAVTARQPTRRPAAPAFKPKFFSAHEFATVAVLADMIIPKDERSGGATTALLSTGPAGGNGAAAALFGGASDDGTRVFFATNESLVAADTDSSQDVYERAAGVTTLLSDRIPEKMITGTRAGILTITSRPDPSLRCRSTIAAACARRR